MTMMGTMQPGFLEDTQMSLALLCLSIQLQPVFLSFPFPFLRREKSIEDDGENQRLRGRSPRTERDHMWPPWASVRREERRLRLGEVELLEGRGAGGYTQALRLLGGREASHSGSERPDTPRAQA